ncbi:MAG: hypothetical protein Fur0022_04880 [Anaerolineales bacterium]
MCQGHGVDINTLTYVIGDHPSTTLRTGSGSTSLPYKADTGATTTQLYKPWGEVRYSSATLPMKYTYTGQYSYAGSGEFGFLYYNARWYDSSLGRFAQADTLVPGAGNPMADDHYMCNITPSETLTRLDIGLRRGLTLPRLYMTYTTSARMA